MYKVLTAQCNVDESIYDISNAGGTKANKNATQDTKSGKNRKRENGQLGNPQQCPKTAAESNKETFDLPPLHPCQVPQIPDPRSLEILT